MHHSLFVGGPESFGCLYRRIHGLIESHGTLPQHAMETASLDVGHRYEGLALGLGYFIDRADIGVIDGGGGPGFMDEALSFIHAFQSLRGEKLERHGPLELGILGLVDDAHSAFAELLQDLIVGYGLADHLNRPGRSN
jgi:hypothetical protein